MRELFLSYLRSTYTLESDVLLDPVYFVRLQAGLSCGIHEVVYRRDRRDQEHRKQYSNSRWSERRPGNANGDASEQRGLCLGQKNSEADTQKSGKLLSLSARHYRPHRYLLGSRLDRTDVVGCRPVSSNAGLSHPHASCSASITKSVTGSCLASCEYSIIFRRIRSTHALSAIPATAG
ncbi:hypothetical protein Mp_4g08970 [Marchantia polymorpha subsp. ruderalis]|uniref:Uncharacterized protein n=2 Tax=Marchantia polymorpha TaxID=3197 RepID=A0AAF6B7X7_MARPO|nr:hypothetical protein MARPO_0188s0018 [Marchantia polymorpha]BBN08111.1 hypothetical protein Mp_4g08970 [Marchantia polymorpha subsp. ruderalis]|eukprot:PTQ27673.1 hypothetical protein MARPO_0188s0018 [Marchantia polymorpha]